MGVFNESTVCGARAMTSEGTVDFPACALSPEQCKTDSHWKGRRGESAKAKKDDAVVMRCTDGPFLAIYVRASSQTVKPASSPTCFSP